MKFKRISFDVNKTNKPEDKELLLKYLKNGKVIGAIPGTMRDPIAGNKIPGNEIFSDGEYEWKADLPYLVNKYNFQVDKDFIDHVKHTNQ